MKLRCIAFLFCCNILAVGAQEIKQPKLIVGIVVDQMRYDYLSRFYNDFGNDGFKRLIKEGLNCKNVHYNYKPTYTGPGHATIFTGTSPAVHGIVGNNWYERAEDKKVYCVDVTEDGVTTKNPKRLLTETFSDGIKQFTNFQSKSFGISLKDRGAILPAGHLADGAYWFDSEKGVWVSDDYYPKSSTDWLSEFNAQNFSAQYLVKGWHLSKSISQYTESLPDQNDFEFPLLKDKNITFPYNLVETLTETDWGVLKKVPQGNQMSADLFKKLVQAESVGKDGHTDFVSLSFSATDYVGHRFGVQSVEVHDTYIKLDSTIGDLLRFLDRQVGEGEYTLFLTSDHGAGMPRAYLKEKGIPNGQLNERIFKKELDSIILKETKRRGWVTKVMNLNVYLSNSLKSEYPNEFLKVKEICKDLLTKEPGIARVVDVLNTSVSTDGREQLALRGYHPKRSGDLILIEEPNWSSYTEKGSTHGSPYEYDTHVPLLFFGSGISSNESTELYSVTAIVPSLAVLFGFQTNQVAQQPLIKELFLK